MAEEARRGTDAAPTAPRIFERQPLFSPIGIGSHARFGAISGDPAEDYAGKLSWRKGVLLDPELGLSIKKKTGRRWKQSGVP
jgi:hypothetical protein